MAANRDLLKAMARLDALTDWERRPRSAMRVGLEPMRDLAARLGDPQKAFRSIHVAGTKGKGSVSALIEAALAHAGLSVGRYGSPHVERVTERVSVQGREIEEPALARALDRALDTYEAARVANTPAAQATWFDLLTAAAFIAFAEARLEWAVVEVGLGGRLDSTNIVQGEVAIVTNIELEHTEILGNSRPAIAGEKVGILKPGAVLVTTLGPDDDAGRVLKARADALACPIIRTRFDPAAASVDAIANRVPGDRVASLSERPSVNAVDDHVAALGERGYSPAATIEEINVALAGAALDQLGLGRVRARSAAAGKMVGAWLLDAETRAAARLPGRMERFDIDVGPRRLPVVLDGAHVPFNVRAVLRDLALTPDLSGPFVAIVALAADKDAEGFVSELAERALAIVFTDLPGSSRGRAPKELKALAASLGLSSEVEQDLERALKRGLELASKANAWLIVTGSLYLVGALRSEIQGAARA
jgi:dihydrofolate synthase/folylpolyglutamate synthase